MGWMKKIVFLSVVAIFLSLIFVNGEEIINCSYNLTNTTWSEWIDIENCTIEDLLNQSRERIQYDSNDCGNYTNETIIEYRNISCDFCTENLILSEWSEWENISCLDNEKMNQSRERTQYDSNDCGNYTDETIIEYRATEDCLIPLLTIISPYPIIYKESKLNVNIVTSTNLSRLEYLDNSLARKTWRTICTNCSSYNKSLIFKEGRHNLNFRGIYQYGAIYNDVEFFIDSIKPRISKIGPRSRAITNGSEFFIRYTEEGCKYLSLNVTGLDDGVHSISSCDSGRNIEFNYPLINISKFDGQGVDYQFMIEDIAGNQESSKLTSVRIDTTSPKIISFNDTLSGRYAIFNIGIEELNFDKILYIDSFDLRPRWKTLCSSLKEDNCYKRLILRIGTHNMKIMVLDDAGNSEIREVSFLVK